MVNISVITLVPKDKHCSEKSRNLRAAQHRTTCRNGNKPSDKCVWRPQNYFQDTSEWLSRELYSQRSPSLEPAQVWNAKLQTRKNSTMQKRRDWSMEERLSVLEAYPLFRWGKMGVLRREWWEYYAMGMFQCTWNWEARQGERIHERRTCWDFSAKLGLTCHFVSTMTEYCWKRCHETSVLCLTVPGNSFLNSGANNSILISTCTGAP